MDRAKTEQQRLQQEIVRALMGESAFTPEMIKSALETQERKINELEQTIGTAKQELDDHQKRIKSLTDNFKAMLEWADLYDMADPCVKKTAVSHIVDRVEVRKGYDLTITLNLSVQQFVEAIKGFN